MKIIEQSGWEYVKFTYDEELQLAEWVMDVLCLSWIETSPEFSKLASKIYYRKCRGEDISGDDFADLLKFEARYNERLPAFPIFDPNAGSIEIVIPPGKKLTKKDRKDYMIREKIRAWREAWKTHDVIKKRVEGCEIFTGDEILDPEQAQIAYQEAQRDRERAFYDEVIRRQAKYEISRQEAIQAVSDTHPRADDDLQWDMLL